MTTMQIDLAVVEQALEALENCSSEYGHRCNRCDSEVDEGGKVASALRTALAQQAEPVQEPVAWQCREHGDFEWFDCGKESYGINPRRYTYRTLFTAPPQRKPLTEEEIDVTTAQARDALLDHIYEYGTAAEGVLERIRKLCRAVERAHGVKE